MPYMFVTYGHCEDAVEHVVRVGHGHKQKEDEPRQHVVGLK